MNNLIGYILLLFIFISSCSSNDEVQKEEQIRISTSNSDSTINSINGNVSLDQISTSAAILCDTMY